MSAVLSVICFWLAKSGHGALAEALRDPQVIENIMGFIGSGLMIYAGLAQGVKPSEAATVAKEIAPDIHDPYPGWDYDPIKGWVPIDGHQ